MSSGSIRTFLSRAALCVLAASAPLALAVEADSLHNAYQILHSKGLLEAPQGTAPARSAAPKAAAKVAAAPVHVEQRLVEVERSPETAHPVKIAESSSIAETTVLPRAYRVLVSLGLLSIDTPAAKAVAPSNKADRVLVDKSDRKLYLMRNGRSFREYRVALGKQPTGHKQQAGDSRTPEGVYTIDWRNPRSRYYKALHISYPNQSDLMRAEQRGVDAGGMIMIHGEHYVPAFKQLYRRARSANWTDGCIALHNEEIDEIWLAVQDGTPIEIRP